MVILFPRVLCNTRKGNILQNNGVESILLRDADVSKTNHGFK